MTTTETRLRVKDVARLLDCSEQHVRNLVNRGEIPGAFKIGKLLRFDAAAVQAWLEAHKTATTTGDKS